MAEQTRRPVEAECRSVAARLEQLVSRVPPTARELFEETARLLRLRAEKTIRDVKASS